VHTYPERIQTPVTSLTNQTKNRAEIVRKHDGTEPANVAKTRSLENLFLLIQELLVLLGVLGGQSGRVDVSAALVDLEDLLGYELKSRDAHSQSADRLIDEEGRTLWLRLKRTKRIQHGGGKSINRSSAKTSGKSNPRPSRARTLS
jgi:hypothetical protein